jgi:hypothetical protein
MQYWTTCATVYQEITALVRPNPHAETPTALTKRLISILRRFKMAEERLVMLIVCIVLAMKSMVAAGVAYPLSMSMSSGE